MDSESTELVRQVGGSKGGASRHPEIHVISPSSAQRSTPKTKGETNKFLVERNRGKNKMGTSRLNMI